MFGVCWNELYSLGYTTELVTGRVLGYNESDTFEFKIIAY